MVAIRGAAMSAVFIDAPPKTRNRYICEVLRRECARWPVASREDRHVSEGPKSRGNAERAPRRGRVGEGRGRPWRAGQAFAPTLVATFGKISDSGVVRRRCQNPRPERIRNRPAALKATMAETSMICPICHHP